MPVVSSLSAFEPGYLRTASGRLSSSGKLQVACGLVTACSDDVVAGVLILIDTIQSGSLHGGDMDRHVLAAALRLDESNALVSVKL